MNRPERNNPTPHARERAYQFHYNREEALQRIILAAPQLRHNNFRDEKQLDRIVLRP